MAVEVHRLLEDPEVLAVAQGAWDRVEKVPQQDAQVVAAVISVAVPETLAAVVLHSLGV